ncbi:hypothetical protein ACIRO1_34455 [Streptomyces sp. NPDC102381]|uniref:hypothetical protein n=1 Tax=Streptomyces sp. NPDC102381 TaxID=3366164 RepID=UPI00381B5E12
MDDGYGEALRGVREGACSACGAPRAEMIHVRFAEDVDVRRCGECGSLNELEFLVSAPPSEVTHPGAW